MIFRSHFCLVPPAILLFQSPVCVHSIMEDVASGLLARKNLELTSCRTLQSLWAGYGHIAAITAQPLPNEATKPIPLILKYITPPPTDRGQKLSEGHVRKLLSYQIEQHFYTHLAPLMPPDVSLATCLASSTAGSESAATAMIMTDLRQSFPVAGEKRAELNKTQAYAALDWLAGFHGFWWNKVKDLERDRLCQAPLEHYKKYHDVVLKEGAVWLNGGYTYLATRRDEYQSLKDDEDSEWSSALCEPLKTSKEGQSIAELVAKFLSPSRESVTAGPISSYETLIHGDVKSENLFTTSQGDKVAFYDFQYVGLGLGVCDLAKLFTCSVPLRLLDMGSDLQIGMGAGEEALLRYYLDKLERSSNRQYPWDVFVRHWETALVDWLRFQASWGFWGNTDWLEGRVRGILADEEWRSWLFSQVI